MVKQFNLINYFNKYYSRDEAIELADHALTMTNAERIEEFSDLLNDALVNKSKNGI
jgi:hypothetical protein